MFRRKKSTSREERQPPMRGRDSAGQAPGGGGQTAANPLARRFRADREPPTVDLTGPVRFDQSPDETDHPMTAPLPASEPGAVRLLSHDPQTGKFHIHPGNAECTVLLQGEPVSATTELRPGDRIRVGDSEFLFTSAAPD
jgi:hypothetical protein